MFLRIILISCVFLSVSQAIWHRGHHGNHGHGMNHGSHYPRHKTVVMNPPPETKKYNEEEMDAYLDNQRSQLFDLARRVNADASNVCRWNYATLTDSQKRTCCCLNVFSFLNEGNGDPFSEAYKIYMKVWEQLSQAGGPSAACSTRTPNTESSRTKEKVTSLENIRLWKTYPRVILGPYQ